MVSTKRPISLHVLRIFHIHLPLHSFFIKSWWAHPGGLPPALSLGLANMELQQDRKDRNWSQGTCNPRFLQIECDAGLKVTAPNRRPPHSPLSPVTAPFRIRYLLPHNKLRSLTQRASVISQILSPSASSSLRKLKARGQQELQFHLKTQLRENLLPAHSLWCHRLLGWGISASCSNSFAIVSWSHGSLLPPKQLIHKQVFCNLNSEVTSRHVQFTRSEWLGPAHTQEEGNAQGHEYHTYWEEGMGGSHLRTAHHTPPGLGQ